VVSQQIIDEIKIIALVIMVKKKHISKFDGKGFALWRQVIKKQDTH